jgi:hypothetical protein
MLTPMLGCVRVRAHLNGFYGASMFICGLLNNAVSSSDYMAVNDWMTNIKVLFQHSDKIADVLADIHTGIPWITVQSATA